MKIAQINSTEAYGGAEMIMRTLTRSLRDAGHEVDWLVGRLHESRPSGSVHVFQHDAARSTWARRCGQWAESVWRRHGTHRHGRGASRFIRNVLGQPARWWNVERGHEDFDYPDSVSAVDRIQPAPEVLHFHGLHSNYFDLCALKDLSKHYSVVVTMHDAWMITGHCAYPGSCTGYQRGCGNCPDLDRFPKIKRDATSYNFARKHSIYQNSKIHLVTPSRWLMEVVEAGPMRGAFASRTVIHNGIDTSRFSPGPKKAARKRIGMEAFDRVVIFNAKNARTNSHKDYDSAYHAVGNYARQHPNCRILMQVIGEDAASREFNNLSLRFTTVSAENAVLVDYYRAADVLIHTARSENFPTVILEAMSCGMPVIGSDTGGIREQIEPLLISGLTRIEGLTYRDEKSACGFLVPERDAMGAQRCLEWLWEKPERAPILSANARLRAETYFSTERMGSNYLDLYQQAKSLHSKPEMKDKKV